MAPSHRRPQPQVALHAGPAQVHVAVAQAHRLVDLGPVVDRERRRLGLGRGPPPRSRRARPRRWQLGVDRALGPAPYRALTRTTHSLRTSTEPSTTHWTMPRVVAQVDEGQVLAVLAAPATQPHSVTRAPTSARAAASPHRSGPHRRWLGDAGVAHGAPFVVGGRSRCRPRRRPRPPAERDGRPLHHGTCTLSCAPSPRSGRDGDTSRGELLGPDDQRDRAPGAVGLLELGLQRAAVVGAHRRRARPRAARRSGPGPRSPPVDVDDEGVEGGGVDREARPRRRRPAAAARCRCRSRCPGSAGPPSASASPS